MYVCMYLQERGVRVLTALEVHMHVSGFVGLPQWLSQKHIFPI